MWQLVPAIREQMCGLFAGCPNVVISRGLELTVEHCSGRLRVSFGFLLPRAASRTRDVWLTGRVESLLRFVVPLGHLVVWLTGRIESLLRSVVPLQHLVVSLAAHY